MKRTASSRPIRSQNRKSGKVQTFSLGRDEIVLVDVSACEPFKTSLKPGVKLISITQLTSDDASGAMARSIFGLF